MSLMQPISIDKITPHDDWVYEIKYDGFRVVIHWSHNDVKLFSRNNKELTGNFPEIIAACKLVQSDISCVLPIQLDGELVILNNTFQANYGLIQKRGRLKTPYKMNQSARIRPATIIAFDLLQLQGKSILDKHTNERKRQLSIIFNKMQQTDQLRMIQTYYNYEEISKIVFDYKAEGIVAKKLTSNYKAGKNHHDWYKQKNWRNIYCFLTAYHLETDYFDVAVYKEETVMPIGTCKHGLDQKTLHTLKELFMKSGEKNFSTYSLPPAICAQMHTLDLHANEIREPNFKDISPGVSPKACTTEKLLLDLAMLPAVDLSNIEKVFWAKTGLLKRDLLIYMREIFPYMIPYIMNRALTVIRCPDGVEADSFFQKNLPSYAPDYIDVMESGDSRIQLCNRLESLIWFANHSAIEYHIPFQTVDSNSPTDIVFDLDPPNRDAFSLATEAALIIKQLLDELNLTSFVKTSGNKGLQIHVPIAPNSMSYSETAIFTEAIAKVVVKTDPAKFTVERFKKSRGKKLYIDYVQHGKNRTIVAPYSPRKVTEATVATPLYWEEVNDHLFPTQFTIQNVVERVQTLGCPWLKPYEKARDQSVSNVLAMIRTI